MTSSKGFGAVAATHSELGERYLYCEGDVPLLFTENETNNERIFGTPNASPYVKDGINDYVVARKAGRRQPGEDGNKSCRALHHQRWRTGNGHDPAPLKRLAPAQLAIPSAVC